MNLLKSEIVQFFTNFITKGHERSVRAKKNIVSSLIIKGMSILISFVMLPITLSYVDSATYGVWLTISSIVGWFVFFDVGLTQGLRNRLAETKARGEDDLAQIYVSTTYAILGIIFTGVWIVFLIVNNFLDWTKILKVSETMRPDVTNLAVIVFTYFCISFVFRIITTILLADQYPAKSSLIDLVGQVLSLLIIVILVKTTEGSLVKLGLALCISPLVVLIGANLIFFNGKYKRYRPTVSRVRFSYSRDLFNLGLKFFIIQMASIIQYQTANIIIARNFGTADVTAYNVVYKYFGIPYMIFNIFLVPFWSAATEAYQKNDINWIRNGIRRYNQLSLLMLLGTLIMLIFSGPFYRMWLGEGKVSIAFSLSLLGFLYFNVMMFGAKYVQFLNGISALRIQFMTSIISPVLYLAVVLVLVKYFRIGVYSIFIGAILASFNGYILAPIQYHMIIKKNKKGIWIK
ncbi:MAG: MATE family efflux transporter [Prolixibacteraceae bacterium]|nr:MATE family efflux transporter [Prolixibacteraceae bacterium]